MGERNTTSGNATGESTAMHCNTTRISSHTTWVMHCHCWCLRTAGSKDRRTACRGHRGISAFAVRVLGQGPLDAQAAPAEVKLRCSANNCSDRFGIGNRAGVTSRACARLGSEHLLGRSLTLSTLVIDERLADERQRFCRAAIAVRRTSSSSEDASDFGCADSARNVSSDPRTPWSSVTS